MELGASTWWWVAAGVAVALELATGTFYLLMLALGLAAGALAAHAGFAVAPQLVVAALVGAGAVAACRWLRPGPVAAAAPQANPDLNIDIGQRLAVPAWNGRSARVTYRGAAWSVHYTGAGDPLPGEFVIRAIEANALVVERADDIAPI
ncbi:NfeD family protein [Aquabacterium sp. A7-Y]|uniref:NfeD family protein n=1 Tax=Aquabacterium sp. A7-Y TaxID=1349605 RepID=UPI00223D4484|nr:NfeD family protein [Aquabacterium sp. A7-Y]MCW7540928.1 NfeD family protein [Aquabacterium sp. A7-Y]